MSIASRVFLWVILNLMVTNTWGGTLDVCLSPIRGKMTLNNQYVRICHARYTILYDIINHRPVATLHYLTPEMVLAAKTITRAGTFKNDPLIIDSLEPSVKAYGGIYDRGHLVPAGDMPNVADQNDTFVATNKIPQLRELNRGAWKNLEEDIRNGVHDETLIITAVEYGRGDSNKLISTDTIPLAVWKVVKPNKSSDWIFYRLGNTSTTDSVRTLTCSNFNKAIVGISLTCKNKSLR